MSKFVQTSDPVFRWNKAVSHLGYCIVEQNGKFRLFTPDGILLDERHDSLNEAKLQASYYFLESAVQELLDDWHEAQTIEPGQYNKIRSALSSKQADTIWLKALQMESGA